MLTLPLAGGGTLAVSSPDLEETLLRTHAETLAREEATQRALSEVYRVGGQPDPTRPFSGLLTVRLNVSEKTARLLLTEGRLGYLTVGEKKGYRVTERQVREFEAREAA